MEGIISRELSAYLEANSLLSDSQFGFRHGRSTEDQLLLTYHEISSNLDSLLTTDLLLFDFSKAFDMVNHQVLITKLTSIGINSSLTQWIKAFLTDRSFQVIVSGKSSSQHPVSSGVPQGSVLGPILFLVYINHITHSLTCSYKIFADDLKLYL